MANPSNSYSTEDDTLIPVGMCFVWVNSKDYLKGHKNRTKTQNNVNCEPSHILLGVVDEVCRLFFQVGGYVLFAPAAALMPHNVDNQSHGIDVEADSLKLQPVFERLRY
jgi:hypothetical protein